MILIAMDRAPARRPHIEGYAIDRASGNRYFDVDGRLHVRRSTISKANVCPYYGWEVPNGQELGLDADTIYYFWRHPDELAKAADTFNNLQILSEHIPVTAWDDESHRAEVTVGSTGTDCAFDGMYLTNSQVVWAKRSIDGVMSNRQRENSSAYRWRADMTPGIAPEEFGGLPYHGVMRDIVGNHVALVVEGRAGPDVLVGDEAMKSRRALMLSGSLAALVMPKLAKDAKFDIKPLLGDVTAASIAMDGAPAALSAKVIAAATPLLAAAQTIDADALTATIAYVAGIAMDSADEIPEPTPASSPAPSPTPSPTPTPTPAVTDPPAMDAAAVQVLVDAGKAEVRTELLALDTARKAVHPHVGEVTADTPDAIYKIALDAAVKDGKLAADALASAPTSAYPAMVSMLPDPNAQPVAQDHRQSGASKLAGVVPNLSPIKVL